MVCPAREEVRGDHAVGGRQVDLVRRGQESAERLVHDLPVAGVLAQEAAPRTERPALDLARRAAGDVRQPGGGDGLGGDREQLDRRPVELFP